MRKGTVIFAIVLVGAGVAVAVAAAMGTFAGSSKDDPVTKYVSPAGRASLYPMGTNPLRLRGRGFAPGEHVRVAAKDSRKGAHRKVTAGPKGGFVTTLAGIDSCDSVNVVAVGDKGSRASFNLSSFVCGQ